VSPASPGGGLPSCRYHRTVASAPDDPPEAVTGRAVRHGMLRAGLELAVVVARSGAEARPAVPVAPPLRPFLRHIKWTPRALATVARVVDDDDGFRARVATAADALGEADLDPWSRAWLVRPDGWAAALAAEVDRREVAEGQRRMDKEERSARRQLSGLTEELARRTAELALADQRAREAEAEASEQRRLRRAAESELAGARAEAQSSRRTADEIRQQLDRLAAEAAEVAARSAAHLAAETRDRQEILGLRGEQDRLTAQVAELNGQLEAARARRREVEVASGQRGARVAGAVSDAAAAARSLGEALARAATALEGGLAPKRDGSPGPHPAERATAGAVGGLSDGGNPSAARPSAVRPSAVRPSAVRPSAVRLSVAVAPAGHQGDARPGSARFGGDRIPPGAHRSRRQPVSLPPAVFEDSQEAAAHLVRSGVLLLVDGYNVSLRAWPGVALGPQRHRLISALGELAARSGAAVRVIFDGDDQQALPPVPGVARDAVRVAFSSPGVDADEVIIAAVDQHPAGRPVVVATDDRRVQDEVKMRGANVLTTPQLLGLLRRADQKS
jgi:predicted RNA-binding protein with PIN domain